LPSALELIDSQTTPSFFAAAWVFCMLPLP
jgi:hypothetical protein